jgi:hypothetical protein
MKELFEYRQKMIQRLGKAVQEFCDACRAVSDPFTKIEDGWNVHQIASHTRDVDKLVYGARIERTLKEDNPEFKNFDADEWMAAYYNPQEPLGKILDEFANHVDDLRKMLEGQPQEVWSRESRHPELGGGLTLQLWVERSLAHIEEHLSAVKRLKVN